MRIKPNVIGLFQFLFGWILGRVLVLDPLDPLLLLLAASMSVLTVLCQIMEIPKEGPGEGPPEEFGAE